MIITEDIKNRIHSDFRDKADEAILVIENEILSDECLNSSEIFNCNSNRIIRCIIYLANKKIDDLNKYIKAAKGDPRDVICWAEYTNHDDKFPLHVRDLSKPFDFAEFC